MLSLSTPSPWAALFGGVSSPTLGMEHDNGGGFTRSHEFQAQEASSRVCAKCFGWLFFLLRVTK